MKTVLKLLMPGLVLTLCSGCIIHHGHVHYPRRVKREVVVVTAPPPTRPPVVVVAPPPPARPPVVIVKSPPPRPPKEPWVNVNVTIATHEREVIREWVVQCNHGHGNKKGHKGKALPPGLAKKAARGHDLPPGWQKKLVRGEVMRAEVYRHCDPLPQEVIVRLPPPPPGTILVTIDGKVVRLAKATMEILDVFEVL